MRLATSINNMLSVINLQLIRITPSIYDRDGFRSGNNHDFIRDPAFVRAYRRGVKAAGEDYQFEWRVHTALWAASYALALDGDFVECGVNKGFMSSAIMQYLDWNSCDRTFYLCDTFHGLDPRFVSEDDRRGGALEKNEGRLRSGFYTRNLSEVQANFGEWRNVQFVVGSVPETLPQITSKRVAFVHIDMNCAPPEVAAVDYLWSRLVPGAFVLLDDYGFGGHEAQKRAMDEFAKKMRISVLSLPTGQGLMVRPEAANSA